MDTGRSGRRSDCRRSCTQKASVYEMCIRDRLTEPVFTIRDITEQTASVTVEYIVSYMRQEKETFAVVDEVYRVRQGTDGTMYLLDFERRMSDIFSEDKSAFVGDKIALEMCIRDSILPV